MDIGQFLLEPLQYPFMQKALLAALIVGVVNGVIGTYVVTRGMAFLGDALAHSVLPGVAVAYLTIGQTGGALLLGGLVAGVISALGVGWLTRGRRVSEDSAIGIVFAGMLALGIALISLSHNFTADLTHILIGDILAVRDDELLLMGIISAVVVLIVWAFYKEFLLISFDEGLAETLGLPREALRLALLVMLAVTIVASLQVVGVALVTALLVTPAATARFFTHRLHVMMGLAALLGCIGGVVGLYAAWHFSISASAAMVLCLTALFILAFLFAPHSGWLWTLRRKTGG